MCDDTDTTIYVYSTDTSLYDTSADYTVEAIMVNYPSRIVLGSATISYVDPCASPIALNVPDKNVIPTIGPYKYDSSLL